MIQTAAPTIEMLTPNTVQDGRQKKKDSLLEAAMEGTGVFSPNSVFFDETDHESNTMRLSRYRELWSFYDGTSSPTTEGSQPRLNLSRLAVSKTCDWLFGQPWILVPEPGNELMAELVEEILRNNQKDVISYCAAHSGAVTGDVWFTVSERDVYMRGVSDDLEGMRDIFVNYLKPQYVHPVFDPMSNRHLLGTLVQYPVGAAVNENGDVYVDFNVMDDSLRRVRQIFSQYTVVDQSGIGAQVREYFGAQKSLKGDITTPIFGKYHAQNIPSSRFWNGESDLEDGGSINNHVNDILTRVSKNVQYNASPIITITGAAADSLDRRENAVWMIPQEGARVNLLETSGNMGGAKEHYENILDAFTMVTQTPKNSLGMAPAISNTKAAAIDLLLLPLLEKTKRKRITYGALLLQVCGAIAQLIVLQNPSILKRLGSPKKAFRFQGIRFCDPVPRDERERIEVLALKLKNKMISSAEAIRNANSGADMERIALEIVSDSMAEGMREDEKAQMLAGNSPNILSPMATAVATMMDDKSFESILSSLKNANSDTEVAQK